MLLVLFHFLSDPAQHFGTFLLILCEGSDSRFKRLNLLVNSRITLQVDPLLFVLRLVPLGSSLSALVFATLTFSNHLDNLLFGVKRGLSSAHVTRCLHPVYFVDEMFAAQAEQLLLFLSAFFGFLLGGRHGNVQLVDLDSARVHAGHFPTKV